MVSDSECRGEYVDIAQVTEPEMTSRKCGFEAPYTTIQVGAVVPSPATNVTLADCHWVSLHLVGEWVLRSLGNRRRKCECCYQARMVAERWDLGTAIVHDIILRVWSPRPAAHGHMGGHRSCRPSLD